MSKLRTKICRVAEGVEGGIDVVLDLRGGREGGRGEWVGAEGVEGMEGEIGVVLDLRGGREGGREGGALFLLT